tara:strand:+ start:165 stop:389 length:225 start_codon:yes stop_codon:yes gene_type:complete
MAGFVKKHLRLIERLETKEINRENFLTLDKNEDTEELSKRDLNKIKNIRFSKKIKLYPVLNDLYNLIAKKFKKI